MSGGEARFAAALKDAHVVHTHAELVAAIERMGADIDRALGGDGAVFLTVMNGALVFAGHLALAIRAPLTLDYVHATRYHHGTEGKHLEWIRHPSIDLVGRRVILVDDILDEGHTLKAIRDDCLARGAAEVLVAVLCSKRHARRIDGIGADFCCVTVPDAFVFGFGMDIDGLGRNLPHIYAPGVTHE